MQELKNTYVCTEIEKHVMVFYCPEYCLQVPLAAGGFPAASRSVTWFHLHDFNGRMTSEHRIIWSFPPPIERRF